MSSASGGAELGASGARAFLRSAAQSLDEAGCESPRLDAELLLACALQTDRAGLRRLGDEPLDSDVARRAQALINRRIQREPVAQITGQRWFRNLELKVDSNVLSPRPETELLVEWALDLPPGAVVADVGTGSGAIALALADERPDLKLIATDISVAALAVAQANADRLGLHVDFRLGNLLEPISEKLDAVISNPPYIPEGDMERLAPEVSKYEPWVALTPGPDGLKCVRDLAAQAAERGVELIAMEIGHDQAQMTAAILKSAGWAQVESLKDLAGIDRVVAATGRKLRA